MNASDYVLKNTKCLTLEIAGTYGSDYGYSTCKLLNEFQLVERFAQIYFRRKI